MNEKIMKKAPILFFPKQTGKIALVLQLSNKGDI